MANKRMFSLDIVDTDSFLEMPQSARLLYYDLGMRADDDGFVASPKKIMMMTKSNDDDLKLLFAKSYVIPFESGICVISHWRINNYIRKDRYTETVYKEEKSKISTDESDIYKLGCHLVYQTDTECSVVKSSIDKSSIVKDIPSTEVDLSILSEVETDKKIKKSKYGEYKHVMLTEVDISKLKVKLGEEKKNDCIRFLDEYIEMKNYKAKNHYLCILKWVKGAVEEENFKTKGTYSIPDYKSIVEEKVLTVDELNELFTCFGKTDGS